MIKDVEGKERLDLEIALGRMMGDTANEKPDDYWRAKYEKELAHKRIISIALMILLAVIFIMHFSAIDLVLNDIKTNL